MQTPRTHKRHLGNTFDTIASHSHHAAVIAYLLAKLEGGSDEQGLQAMAMAILHDIPEARTGDQDYVAKHYGEVNEAAAIDDQLNGLPGADHLIKLYGQWQDKESLSARCAKDADALEQRYQEWVLMYMGNKMAERWYQIGFKDRIPYYKTESAKRLALMLDESHPQAWWWKDIEKNGVNQKHLNS